LIDNIFGIAIVFAVVFFSVILHEISHGFVALIFHDDTAKNKGRLTLNPIPHIDLFGTILLPLLLYVLHAPLFGWAKPVPVDFNKLNPNKLGMICVSLAGCFTNFLLAFVAGMFLRFGVLDASGFLGNVAVLVAYFNILLGTFNMLPVPPLDGSRLWTTFAPLNVRYFVETNQFLFIFFVLFLLMSYPGVLMTIVFKIFYLLVGFIPFH